MAEHVEVLIAEADVDARIQAIGEQISRDYEGRQVHLVCVLKGGSFFMCELARELPCRYLWTLCPCPAMARIPSPAVW